MTAVKHADQLMPFYYRHFGTWMPSKSILFSALTDHPFWSRIGLRLIQEGLVLMLAAYLVRLFYNRFMQEIPQNQRTQVPSKAPRQNPFSTVRSFFFKTPHRFQPPAEEIVTPTIPQPSSSCQKMCYPNNAHTKKRGKMAPASISFNGPRIKQPYEVFLVMDIEGTCEQGSGFNYPNEIIELPVCMLRWKDRQDDGKASLLELVDEFRTFVRPTWRPKLSAFCTQLTGITQSQVDAAPIFPEALIKLESFLVKNGLIDPETGQRLIRFCWCSDGPSDIRDFVVKQCFISQMKMPSWVQGDVLDVRSLVVQSISTSVRAHASIRRSMNISAQLKSLGLPAFEGRQHSGIDDSRNIAKVVTELARRDVYLLPNTVIRPDRRWPWMGKSGQVLENCQT